MMHELLTKPKPTLTFDVSLAPGSLSRKNINLQSPTMEEPSKGIEVLNDYGQCDSKAAQEVELHKPQPAE